MLADFDHCIIFRESSSLARNRGPAHTKVIKMQEREEKKSFLLDRCCCKSLKRDPKKLKVQDWRENIHGRVKEDENRARNLQMTERASRLCVDVANIYICSCFAHAITKTTTAQKKKTETGRIESRARENEVQ